MFRKVGGRRTEVLTGTWDFLCRILTAPTKDDVDTAVKVVYEFRGFQLDPANQLLLHDGVPVPLTPKVFSTLVLLVEQSGQLVEKDEFLRRLWPGTFVEEAALAENISRLRRALGDDGDGQRLIVTVPKRGYRFGADVRKIEALEQAQPVAVPARSRRSLALGGVALLVAIGVSYLSFGRASRGTSRSPAAPIASLAVLPIENLSRDPEQEYFADGVTDELITQLAKISALRVISRTSVMPFKGTRKGLAEIARALNVDAVVEGTVVRSVERVRVTAQVVQVNPEKSLWAERFDRPLGDIVVLQGELAREIAQAIRITLTSKEQTSLGGVRPVKQEAYEAFIKGRYYWNKRTEEATNKAITYFQQAVEKDPTYALAFSGLADSYYSLALAEALQEVVAPMEAFPKARAAATRALELDDTLAEAHASLAHIKFQYDRDWPGAEREFKRAIGLNANFANAHHWYALYLMWVNRLDEAIVEAKRARELDPLSLTINANMGFILAGAHQYDRGVEECRNTLDMDPNFALAHYRLGQILVLEEKYAEAVPELEKAIALSGASPRATAELGLAYARMGKKADALRLLAELKDQSDRRYVSPFNLAVVYGGLGDNERTLEWLEKAYNERSPSLSLLRLSPAFDGVRSDPRFNALVQRVGLPPISSNPQ
jgi:TolB-like protein/DNA-binding winged helix-turn-helix (wHTH) protein/Flp pilus assembly protein TadD